MTTYQPPSGRNGETELLCNLPQQTHDEHEGT